MGSDTRTLTIKLIGREHIGVRVFKNTTPAEGAQVSLTTEAVSPVTFTKWTDADGFILWRYSELGLRFAPALEAVKWLVCMSIPETDYGFWKRSVTFKLGTLTSYKLKRYTTIPTFYTRFELRDVIGRDLFADLLTRIQEWSLTQAGFELVEVKGVGTRAVTVYFKPPWIEESPIAIPAAATALGGVPGWIIGLILLALVIIALLIVIKWVFGEVAAVVVAGGMIIVILILLILLTKRPAIERIRRRLR